MQFPGPSSKKSQRSSSSLRKVDFVMALRPSTDDRVDCHRLQANSEKGNRSDHKKRSFIDYWTFGGESGTSHMIVNQAYTDIHRASSLIMYTDEERSEIKF